MGSSVVSVKVIWEVDILALFVPFLKIMREKNVKCPESCIFVYLGQVQLVADFF